jgi:hypothetical protein
VDKADVIDLGLTPERLTHAVDRLQAACERLQALPESRQAELALLIAEGALEVPAVDTRIRTTAAELFQQLSRPAFEAFVEDSLEPAARWLEQTTSLLERLRRHCGAGTYTYASMRLIARLVATVRDAGLAHSEDLAVTRLAQAMFDVHMALQHPHERQDPPLAFECRDLVWRLIAGRFPVERLEDLAGALLSSATASLQSALEHAVSLDDYQWRLYALLPDLHEAHVLYAAIGTADAVPSEAAMRCARFAQLCDEKHVRCLTAITADVDRLYRPAVFAAECAYVRDARSRSRMDAKLALMDLIDHQLMYPRWAESSLFADDRSDALDDEEYYKLLAVVREPLRDSPILSRPPGS